MSIKTRVDDALFLYDNGRHEGAFLNALLAVAASAKKAFPDLTGDRDRFERFLEGHWRGVTTIEFRGECHTIPRILYKWFRCELVHEGGLPVDIELIDTDKMSLRAGGAPYYTLQLSRGWFNWLIQAVVQDPCNADEFRP